MADDLKGRLLHWEMCDWNGVIQLRKDAAARIRELEAENKALRLSISRVSAARDRWNKHQDKIAFDDLGHALEKLSALSPAPVSVPEAAKVLLCNQDAMSAMCRAAAGSRAHDDEGEFEPLMDLIDFSENKNRAVIFAAIYDALRAIAERED